MQQIRPPSIAANVAALEPDECVVDSSEVRKQEEQTREPKRLLGRKTMEVEILGEDFCQIMGKEMTLRQLLPPSEGSRSPNCVANAEKQDIES